MLRRGRAAGLVAGRPEPRADRERPGRGRSPIRVLRAIPPGSWAVVMGTGIVSVALALDGTQTPSKILAAIAAAIWIALAVLQGVRATAGSRRIARALGDPVALTAVAGTAVLGTRLTMLGWSGAGAPLLVVALAAWLGLVPAVLRRWRTPTTGASFLVTVATESLALLAAALAGATDAAWLLYAALAPLCLGLGFYAFVLSRFELRQLATGAGDHWVSGGALGISATAAGRIAAVARDAGLLPGALGALRTLTLVLWCLAIGWLPALLASELLHPRPRYVVGRWSTVFPIGMYAACSFTTGAVAGISAITEFARIWVWIAVAAWLVTSLATLRRALSALGSAPIDSG